MLKTHVIDLHFGWTKPCFVLRFPALRAVQDGKDVPVGSIGEVLLKTPSLPLGYWEDPEATKELFQDGAWTGRIWSELARIGSFFGQLVTVFFWGECG